MQVGRRERTSTCFTRDPCKNYLLPLLECECADSFNPKLHCDPLMCNQGTSLSTLPISRHIALIVEQLEGNLSVFRLVVIELSVPVMVCPGYVAE